MSRRSNVLGGVGVEVSPSAASTINNIVTIRNAPSYPNITEDGVENTSDRCHPPPPCGGTVRAPVSLREPQPTVSLDNPYAERSLETAEQRKEANEALTSEKHLIDALSIMVDVVYENPLIVNKLVVTDGDTLAALIKLLTMSDGVEILCEEPECTCLSNHLLKVSSIHIVKGTTTTEFKYTHQNAKRILDEHHISIKYIRA